MATRGHKDHKKMRTEDLTILRARQPRRTREGGDPFQQLNLLTIYGHKRTQRPQKDESRRFNHSSCPPNTPNTRRWRPVSTIEPFNDLWPQGHKEHKRFNASLCPL